MYGWADKESLSICALMISVACEVKTQITFRPLAAFKLLHFIKSELGWRKIPVWMSETLKPEKGFGVWTQEATLISLFLSINIIKITIKTPLLSQHVLRSKKEDLHPVTLENAGSGSETGGAGSLTHNSCKVSLRRGRRWIVTTWSESCRRGSHGNTARTNHTTTAVKPLIRYVMITFIFFTKLYLLPSCTVQISGQQYVVKHSCQ